MADFSAARISILCLISDPIMKDVVRDALADAGYLVAIAADLGSAVDRLREIHPDLLITRPYINSMPGETAAAYLRSKQPGLRVLIVSGYLEDDRIRDSTAVADLHFFPKPFTRDELLQKVREVLTANRKAAVQH